MNSPDNNEKNDALPADDLGDIEACFRPVVQQYGRSMFALVMNAGIARQAASALALLAEKHHSRGGMQAVGVLANAYNQVSNAYLQAQGWDEGILAQCDRDIQLAFKGRIVQPGSAILLDS